MHSSVSLLTYVESKVFKNSSWMTDRSISLGGIFRRDSFAWLARSFLLPENYKQLENKVLNGRMIKLYITFKLDKA